MHFFCTVSGESDRLLDIFPIYFVCQKVHLALPILVCLKEKTLCLKFFFTSVAEKLVNKLSKRPIHFAKRFLKDYYQKKGVVENYFHFSTVSEEEIENLLNGLTASKVTGMDSLPARFLKDGAEVIACSLSHIINLSLHSSQIPEDMTNARVVPLYKKQGKTEPRNYRPASILSVTSKIFERIVYNQLEHYLKEKKLLYKLQSGFRPLFSYWYLSYFSYGLYTFRNGF